MAPEPAEYRNTELFFGVVAPVGTDLGPLSSTLAAHLGKFRYQLLPMRLSDFLREERVAATHGVRLRTTSEFARITSLMDAGNELRRLAAMNDVLARYAASDVSRRRGADAAFLPSTAHVLLTVKRPEEVSTLRRIYGPGFFLLGVYTPEDERLRYLQEEKEMSLAQASSLIERDEDEGLANGQRTRATFQLADVFFRLDPTDQGGFQKEVRRFVDLAFGHPFMTPKREEQAMFLAHAASLRSADLSRHVGAVIVSPNGELLATGANDVPRYGGGAYWPGPEDQRDYVLGKDSNKVAIEEILDEIANRLAPKGAREEREAIKGKLRGSRLDDLTEFGRIVHAEMDAITSCGRKGLSPRGGKMFVTTFPCHNCAKHIVASGILEVEYIEPYPKSRAQELHGDSISVDAPAKGKVSFLPYVGVAARRYVDLFSMKLSTGWPMERKAKNGIDKIDFKRRLANPRVPLLPVSYIDHELKAGIDVLRIIQKGADNGEENSRRQKRRDPEAGILDASPAQRSRSRSVAGVETRRNSRAAGRGKTKRTARG